MIWSSFGKRWAALPSASKALSALGVSSFIQTLLDDADAAAAQETLGLREVLTGNRTYYVRTDGSDSNTGLVDSAGGALLTIQKALDIAATIDFAGFTVTIQLGDGTYTATSTVPVCVGQAAAENLIINGNSATPANVIISTTSAAGIKVKPNAMFRVQNLEIRTTTTGMGIEVDGTGAVAEIGTGMRFGACAQAAIYVRQGYAVAVAGYTIAGNTGIRVWATGNGVYSEEFMTITYSGTPAFGTANVFARSGAYVASGASTQSGAATGTRYNVDENAVVATLGGGANFYPGNLAGSAGTTGVYS